MFRTLETPTYSELNIRQHAPKQEMIGDALHSFGLGLPLTWLTSGPEVCSHLISKPMSKPFTGRAPNPIPW